MRAAGRRAGYTPTMGAAWLRAVAAVAYLTVIVALVVHYDGGQLELEDAFLALFVGVSLGAGLLIGRWWSVSLAMASIVVPAASPTPENALFWVLFVPIGVITSAALLGAGTGVRKLIARRAPSRESVAAIVGALLVSGSVVVVAVAAVREVWVTDDQPARPLVVDESRPSYQGVGVGDSAARMRERFGQPTVDRSGGPPAPLGEDPDRLSTPNNLIGGKTFDYPGVAFLVRGGRIKGFVVTAQDAETRAGVGVGDDLEIASKKYREIECGDETFADDPAPIYPYCNGRAIGNVLVWFGGDPIDNITVIAQEGQGWPVLRPRQAEKGRRRMRPPEGLASEPRSATSSACPA